MCFGQLVIYPVINLRRLGLGARAYVEGLEDTVIATLGAFGIDARVRTHAGTRPCSPVASPLPDLGACLLLWGACAGKTGAWAGNRWNRQG